MNDFSRASEFLFSILFADHTTVIIEGYNYNNLILTLNTELNNLDVCLQPNKLTLNMANGDVELSVISIDMITNIMMFQN